MKIQEITIVGPGPVGSDMIQMSSLGLKDAVGGRFFSPYDFAHVQLNANSVDAPMWVCHEGVWQLSSVAGAHTVVGGSGASVTVVVCPQAVAIGSGIAQLSAAIDLTVTAPKNQFGTLIASPTQMTRGDVLAYDMSGTLTGLVGVLSVVLKRIG